FIFTLLLSLFFFLLIRHPPISTLFPYTTLFRSQVYDLDTLQPQSSVMLPDSHYGRSIAQSNNATFAVVENDGGPAGNVDRLNLVTGCAVMPGSLGIRENNVPPGSVLTPSPSQGSILLVQPDGNVKLY